MLHSIAIGSRTVRPLVGELPVELVSFVAAGVNDVLVEVGAFQRREWSCGVGERLRAGGERLRGELWISRASDPYRLPLRIRV